MTDMFDVGRNKQLARKRAHFNSPVLSGKEEQMGILSLVMGILGLVVFDWLGATIGGGMVAASTLQAAMTGKLEVSTGPIWGFGIAIGVILPLVAVFAGIMAIKAQKRKGLGIAGLICGAIAAVIGFALTFSAAAAVDAAAELGKNQMGDAMNQLNDSLNDPATQDALQKAMQEAMKQQ